MKFVSITSAGSRDAIAVYALDEQGNLWVAYGGKPLRMMEIEYEAQAKAPRRLTDRSRFNDDVPF